MTEGYFQEICIVTIFVNLLSGIYSFDYQHVSEWGKEYPDCAGKYESPVDINTDYIKEEIKYPIRFIGYDRKPKEMTLQNNGHTVAINPVWYCDTPRVEGGPLNGKYILDSIHFHWSPTNDRGSEHTINGKHFPLEMHMVHYKKDYYSVKDAKDKPNGLAVIGVIFQINNRHDGSTLKSIVKHFSEVNETDQKSSIKPFPLTIFKFNNEDRLITYPGSLTTPPCSQTVTWLLAAKIHKVTDKQMQAFRQIKLAHGDTENDRPVQPLNKRVLKIVKGLKCIKGVRNI